MVWPFVDYSHQAMIALTVMLSTNCCCGDRYNFIDMAWNKHGWK